MQDEARTAEHAEAIAQQWGESFRKLATDPRIEFEGDQIFVRLWKPLMKDGVKIDRLEVSEPSLGQMKQLDAISGETAKVSRLLMLVCVMTEKEVGALGVRDLAVAARLLAAFTDTARATGA